MFGLAHLSFQYIVFPNSPQMIIDMDAPSKQSPVGYEPVEMTGKPINEGKVVLCPCKVDTIYAQYIKYPPNWENNPLNPESNESWVLRWSLYSVAICSAGGLGWYINKRIKETKKNK